MVISASSLEEEASIVKADSLFKNGCNSKADIDEIFSFIEVK